MQLIREGPIKVFRDRLIRSDIWEEKYFKLFSDGWLEMYDDNKDKHQNERFNLKEVSDCVCFGEYTNNVPCN